MRKLLSVALATVMFTVGAPTGLFAQSAATIGSINGEAVDAGGRAIAGQRVELVQSGQVLQSTTTGTRGTFVFAALPAGDYVVRLQMNGQTAGVRVSVTSTAPVANAMIVAPSAAAPSAAFLTLPILLLLLGGAAAIITTVVVVTGS